jgi:hypothetical protein
LFCAVCTNRKKWKNFPLKLLTFVFDGAILVSRSRQTRPKQKRKEEKKMVKKVWGFNCFGVCIVLIEENKIDEYNAKHPLFNEKIISWKNAD